MADDFGETQGSVCSEIRTHTIAFLPHIRWRFRTPAHNGRNCRRTDFCVTRKGNTVLAPNEVLFGADPQTQALAGCLLKYKIIY
jgi:hypothetical protein